MALTKIGTDGVKDDAITSDKVANAINSAIAANTAKTSLEDESVTLAKLEHGTSSNDGKFLRANNGADPTFETVSGTTINSNADNRVITGSGTANTLEGEANFTFNGTTASITGGLSIDGSGNDNASGQDAALHVTTDVSDWAAIFQKSTEYGVKIDSPNSAVLAFALYNGATQKLAIAGDGKITAQNNLAFASGKGIDFSASSNESGSSTELLDDYERGTFTGYWTFAPTNASSVTYTYQGGMYVKVGRLVYFVLHMWTSNKGTLSSGSGWCQISGLPFAVDGEGGFASIAYYDNFGSFNPSIARPTPAEQIYIAQHNSGGYSQDLQHSHMNNTTRMHIGGCYATTS